jgi:hypothetical protein
MEAVKRINAFDWDRAFPEIIQKGGFDAVIGNPPYVRQESIKEQKEYFQTHYATYQGTADLYVYFIEKGISLLRKGGLFSYIVANKWMRANYGKPLRDWLKGKCIEEIVDFGDLPVFTTATTYPCILRVKNDGPGTSFHAVSVENLSFTSLDDYVSQHSHSIEIKNLDDGGWTLTDAKSQELLKKIQKVGIPLGKYVEGKIFYGIKTGLNKAFVIDETTRKKMIQEDPKSAEIIKPFLVGKDIKRYHVFPSTKKYLLYIPWHFPLNQGNNISGVSREAEIQFKKDYPVIFEYLSKFKEELTNRNISETGVRYEWYALQRFGSDYFTEFEKQKICWGNLSQESPFAYDLDYHYVNAPACFLISNDSYFLLGCLNSALLWWFLRKISAERRGGFIEAKPMYVSQIPIRTINFSDPADKARHDKMVALVERMLALHKKRAEVRIDHEKNLIEGQIEATDKQIDSLAYDLYGLTEEEIGIVEGAGK